MKSDHGGNVTKVDFLKVCIFGNYYPHFERSATITSALSFLLDSLSKCTSITVYGNRDSSLPPVFKSGRVLLKNSWSPDDIVSLIKVSFRMILDDRYDMYIFNIYLTCFGRKRISNLFGLLMPIAIRWITGKRVLTYMHNFLETQEIERLGYSASRLTRIVVKMVEKALALSTQLVTTLPSMASKMESVLGRKVGVVLIPYADAAIPYVISKGKKLDLLDMNRTVPNILLFGTWGPQKDIKRILTMLNEMIAEHSTFNVIVAGSINKNFPSYRYTIENCIPRFNNQRFKFIWDPSESEISSIFMMSDAIILPYNATGGASGVLQLAAFYSLNILAYEAQQLRELSELIDEPVNFFSPDDSKGIKNHILTLKVRKPPQFVDLDLKMNHSIAAVERLIENRQ